MRNESRVTFCGGLLSIVFMAGLALPAQGAPDAVAVERTYEEGVLAPGLDGRPVSIPDPTGLTEDGSIDLGGVRILRDQLALPPGTNAVQVFVADLAICNVEYSVCIDPRDEGPCRILAFIPEDNCHGLPPILDLPADWREIIVWIDGKDAVVVPTTPGHGQIVALPGTAGHVHAIFYAGA